MLLLRTGMLLLLRGMRRLLLQQLQQLGDVRVCPGQTQVPGHRNRAAT
jgi:hypothetical protein